MKEINIMVVDSQGGGLGKQLVSAIKKEYPDIPAYETYDELLEAIKKAL